MTATIIVIGPKDKGRAPKDAQVINTTSRATDNWQTGLSPFHLGPCKLWGDHVAKNMENGWQYSKVYSQHYNDKSKDGRRIKGYVFHEKEWLEWAKQGWGNAKAVRYPMGKGAAPEFSYWGGETYGYVEARAKIYIPLYARAVRKTLAFKRLKQLHKTYDELYLWDFDGYPNQDRNMGLAQVLACPTRKMGHAFVLKMMLEWGDDFWKVK